MSRAPGCWPGSTDIERCSGSREGIRRQLTLALTASGSTGRARAGT
jgi:hypothetical protein